MSRGVSQQVMATQVAASSHGALSPTSIVVEEPLEIRLDDQRISTTMRTPGHDFELAAGFCLAEGYLANTTIREVRYCDTGAASDAAFNVVTVDTEPPHPMVAPRLATVSASCGVCGTDQIHDLAATLSPVTQPHTSPNLSLLGEVQSKIAAEQKLFDETGGSHAAALFDPCNGNVHIVREDIGRHNAVDKVVGWLVLNSREIDAPLALWVSGRTSFEICQKGWAAGVCLVASVSAPSTMSLEAAKRAEIALVGFSRDDRYTMYHMPDSWKPG